MPVYKGIIGFTSPELEIDTGWTRQIYMVASGSIPGAMDQLGQWVAKRVMLLGAGILCNKMFVSNVAVLNDSLVTGGPASAGRLSDPPYYNIDFSPNARDAMGNPIDNYSDFANRTFLARFSDSARTTHVTFVFRGCPD